MTDNVISGVAQVLPQATQIILSNELKCWVYPISARDRLELIQAFNKSNPMPDKKAYEIPVATEDASFEGQTLSADSNPEYQKVMADRRIALSEYLTSAFLVGYTEFPDYTEQDLIDKFARIIKRKRRVLDMPTDEWEATLLFALIENPKDQGLILSAVESRLPVEMEDVIDNVKIFRIVNQ